MFLLTLAASRLAPLTAFQTYSCAIAPQVNICRPKINYLLGFGSNRSTNRSISRLMMSSSEDRVPHRRLPTSIRTIQSLDPCVILMKQIISQHAPKWESDPDGIYSLAQGVVYWRPPPPMYRELAAAASSNLDDTNDGLSLGFGMDGAMSTDDGRLIHTYCPDEGYPPLLEALKIKLEKENGIMNPHVMVTSGANQAFVNCVLTLLDERDEIGNVSKCVVFKPYYFNHVMAIQMSRGGLNSDASLDDDGMNPNLIEGLLVGPTSKGVPDLTWLRSQLEQHRYPGGGNAIRMVALVNPGNPTGVSLPFDFLREIKELTKEFGVWLIMDNTYEHFDIMRKNSLPNVDNTNNARDYPCFDEEHVINIFSFSKGYSMAGFRVGYISLSSKSSNRSESKGRGTVAYQEMLKVQDTIAICTSRISQMAALGALQAGRSWVHEQVETLNVGRQLILDAMSSMEEIIGGDGAMYVMGKLPDGQDDKEFASKMIEHYGVAVIPGSFCGYPGWIRVCYSNLPPAQCRVAAARLKNGLTDLCRKT